MLSPLVSGCFMCSETGLNPVDSSVCLDFSFLRLTSSSTSTSCLILTISTWVIPSFPGVFTLPQLATFLLNVLFAVRAGGSFLYSLLASAAPLGRSSLGLLQEMLVGFAAWGAALLCDC